MSLNVTFHNPQLIEVVVVNDQITSLDIYDSPDNYGSRLVFYFSNPTEVADWANKIAAEAHKINRRYILDKLGV